MRPVARIKRAVIWNFLTALFVDAGLSIAAYLLFASSNESLFVVLIFYAVILGARFTLWIRQTIILWLTFVLFRRNIIRDTLLHVLKSTKYPPIISDDLHDYFSYVANNDENDIKLRINASQLYGEFANLKQDFQFQQLLQSQIAFSDAAIEYDKITSTYSEQK